MGIITDGGKGRFISERARADRLIKGPNSPLILLGLVVFSVRKGREKKKTLQARIFSPFILAHHAKKNQNDFIDVMTCNSLRLHFNVFLFVPPFLLVVLFVGFLPSRQHIYFSYLS